MSSFQIYNVKNSEDHGKDKTDSFEVCPFPSFKPTLECLLSNSCSLTESSLSFSKTYLRQFNGFPFQSFKWIMTVGASELRMNWILNSTFHLPVLFLSIFVANSMDANEIHHWCKPFKIITCYEFHPFLFISRQLCILLTFKMSSLTSLKIVSVAENTILLQIKRLDRLINTLHLETVIIGEQNFN